MKLTQLISLNALLFIGLGIAFALYGPLMLAFFGVPDVEGMDVIAYWNTAAFARLFGAALFGFGLLLWAARGVLASENSTVSPEARRGIVFALVLANLMGVFMAVVQQFSVWQGPAGWGLVALFALLLLGYGFTLAVRENLAN